MEEEDISLFLSDDSSDEEVIFKTVPVLEDNNQTQRPKPILDDQIDAVEDIGQVKPILEEDDKEMEEELLETVPEQAPVNEGTKQKYQLDQAEAIKEVEHILEEEDKETVEEVLDTILEQAPCNDHGFKEQDQPDQAKPILEEDGKKMEEEPLDTKLHQATSNEGATQKKKFDQEVRLDD